ncbi:MAG: 3-carboxyethylcatechol 2,3-dioxygenase [Proteobacteria bacterium]|nr:3-carboxyethylcatechol 2,3-dioxygenase [Pseudomonadota bacterium]
MSPMLLCSAHSPLLYCCARPPACREASERLTAERAAAIAAADPELVIVFGPDHYNGFFLRLVPPFCAGLRCHAVADIGGFPGELDVAADTALELIDAVRRAGVDLAVSYDMTVDHGFSQTMTRVLGSLDRYPSIPVFINGITPPYVPFRRSRLLGEATGAFVRALGKRVLFLASGGMSHNPTRYYPAFGSAEPAVTDYQLHGGTGKGLSHPEWLERLERMHREGAHMLVDGTRTRADLKLNPEVDHLILDILTSERLEDIDAIEPEWMVEHAGIGSLELHTWVAATAAHRVAGGARPVVDLYAEALEYGIAFGMMHG